jgi:hypothetical protein
MRRMLSRGLRLYGVLNLLFAAFYGWIAFVLVPSRRMAFPVGAAIVCALLACSGVGLLARRRLGIALARVACITLLAGCAAVIVGLVLSSAYLRGVYGGFGRGAAVMSLVIAALVFEIAGLLPLFELRFLARDDVRNALPR